ncbi:hypothetical protein [uncultured Kordia sp.]|uniref:hypothetical protein n=1 Tax=uncultured Kordia sp. TaxID=507699 RepID=UPI00260892B5|nr:hypothetical protein [uncultured Kordia sp.]
MKNTIYIVIGILVVCGIVYSIVNLKKNKKSSETTTKTEESQEIKIEQPTVNTNNSAFSEKLNQTKKGYPFKAWREAFFEYEMEQYSEENCNAAKAIFDNLIAKLITLGEHGNEKDKIALFEKAVNSLNTLDNSVEGLIETGEREDLCELIDQITIASGLNPEDYADGEGIADLWREW